MQEVLQQLDNFIYDKLTDLCGEYGARLAELYTNPEDTAGIALAVFRLDNELRSAYQRWLRKISSENT